MKTLLKNAAKWLGFVVILTFILGINSIALAEGMPGGTAQTDLKKIIDGSGLPDFTGSPHPDSSVAEGADVITTVIFRALDFAKYLLGAVAVIFMILSGINLITAETRIDEVAEKEKKNLKFIIYGLVLVIIADELVTKVFFGDYGECLASASNAKECAKFGGSVIKGLYSLILALMASISIFMFVYSAFRLITSTGEEEVIAKQKKYLAAAIAGLLIAGVAEFAIKDIVFPEGGTKGIDVKKAQNLVYQFTNFISAFIGAGAFAMFFYGGWMYVASAGNEEQTGKAKKIIWGAVIGILIALAAFGITRTLTSIGTGGAELNLPETVPGLAR